LEYRRGKTRFVYMENVLTELSLEDMSFAKDGGLEEAKDGSDDEFEVVLKNSLMSIFQGKKMSDVNNNMDYRGMMEEDIQHAFQEALREALCRDTVCPLDPCQDNSCQGVELFMKSDTTAGKKNKGKKNGGDAATLGGMSILYDHLHMGMRSNGDATRLIKLLQGKKISLSLELPKSLLDQVTSKSSSSVSQVPTTMTIVTGKLFLDYADVLLPKGRNGNNKSSTAESATPGEPSRSECTSTTNHVHIPGLHLLPNYVTEREEQILLAALSGPHAPWAPTQYTPSGGQIRRRVQHYGYVFDYESADVLRRDEDEGEVEVEEGTSNGDDGVSSDKERSACPPLPSMKTSRQSVLDMNDESVDQWIDEAVQDVKGWEALAGVIEKTRRFDFAASPAAEEVNSEQPLDEKLSNVCLNGDVGDPKGNSSDNHVSSETSYPDINQVTINEYTPGQGIGSHVDTLTAFEDGLLIITLNGGIVMEFRKVGTTNNVKKLVYLPPRSLILLSGDARYKWEHMIVSRSTDTVDGKVLPRKLRVSLTLRTALAVPKVGKQALPLPLYESMVFPPRWGQLSDDALSNAKRDDRKDGSSDARQSTERSDLVTPATESKHVHDVYDAIATQWHHTRGKRGVLWPGATLFLENLPPGSVVADVGCGDGKYFSAIYAAHSYVIGTDISEPLLKTATTAASSLDVVDGSSKKKGLDSGPQYERLSTEKRAFSNHPAVAVADCIHLPLRSDSCDAAICIAVMHHLSTEGRRIRCLSELQRIVNVGGLINVQAWALEQENDSKRKFHGTDILVPFNAQPKYLQTLAKNEKDEKSPGIQPVEGSKGKGVAQMMAEQYNGAEFDSKKNLVVFQRYCHMYRKGELEQLCEQVPGLEVLEASYEKGNHVVLLRVCEVDGP